MKVLYCAVPLLLAALVFAAQDVEGAKDAQLPVLPVSSPTKNVVQKKKDEVASKHATAKQPPEQPSSDAALVTKEAWAAEYCGVDPSAPASVLNYQALWRQVLHSAPSPVAKLVQVQVMFRHGDRMNGGNCWDGDAADFECDIGSGEVPLQKKAYLGRPEDVSNSVSVPRLFRKVYMRGREQNGKGNCEAWQLTSKGYHQELVNGQLLREAYVLPARPDALLGEGQKKRVNRGNVSSPFLPSPYSPLVADDVFIRSDDIQRTIMSAQAVFEGLYPSSKATSNFTELVDIHTMDLPQDDIGPNKGDCPKLQEVIDQFFESSKYKKHYAAKTSPLEHKLASILQRKSVKVSKIFDCLHTHLCHGFDIPSGITQDIFKAVVQEDTWLKQHMYAFPNRTFHGMLSSGALLSEMSRAVSGAIARASAGTAVGVDAGIRAEAEQGSGEAGRAKLVLYSGHDTSIMSLLSALEVFDGLWPHYASMIVLELYHDPHDPREMIVRLLYNGRVLKLPFCKHGLCSADEFTSAVQRITPPPGACAPGS